MATFRSVSAAALFLLPGLAVGVHVGPAAAARPARTTDVAWSVAAIQHFGPAGNASGYSTVLLAGRQQWAFGGTNPGGASVPVAETLIGRRWIPSALPAGLTDFISDASAAGRRDIWAISGYGSYVLHWNGYRWGLARTWRGQGVLSGVAATGNRSAWIFGTTSGGSRTIGTWRYDAGSWTQVPGLARDISTASAISADDIWAIDARPHADAIVRFGGRRWRAVPAGSDITGLRWGGILAESDWDVWLIGDTSSSHAGGGRLVLAHWNGQGWTTYLTRFRAWAGRLAAAPRGRVIITATSSGIVPTGLIGLMAFPGQITWSQLRSRLGSGVSDATYAARTNSIWASGAVLTRLGGDAAIWVRPLARGRAGAVTD
jgi:hypothetical protein